ncbi:MAG TPA: ABC transporter ATP-binding protein [Candidatus Dormibacteraeota bacterium]|nr:ABC transporter ATP-binding protein [Candidatus Dormibacteraeota bacterium]
MFQRKPQVNLNANHRIVDAKNIWKRYELGGHKIEALRGIDLVVRRGEVVAVMGPSGCGKTTLLNCLSGLDVIDGGTVKIAGQDLKDLTDNQRTDFRARAMGFVFQTYNLLPVLSGVENVELPMLVAGVKPSLARKRALEAIDMVGVGQWVRHRPAEMSGGQRQRFTIARALATQPQIVWADEPTGALDSETSAGIMELMVKLNQRNDQTFVWVTHSEEVGALAKRLIRMRDGHITSDSAAPSPAALPLMPAGAARND